MGDDDDEEDGAQLVSAQPTLVLLQTFRGLTCFLLSMLHLRPLFLPSPCLSFTDGARQLLGFGLGPIQRVDVRSAVAHLGGVCVLLHDGWAHLARWNIACAAISRSGAASSSSSW